MLYDELYSSVGIYQLSTYGISLEKCSAANIRYILDNGYQFDGSLEVGISSAIDYEKKAKIIEIIIWALVFVAGIVLILNYIFNNFNKTKEKQGFWHRFR